MLKINKVRYKSSLKDGNGKKMGCRHNVSANILPNNYFPGAFIKSSNREMKKKLTTF